MSRRDAAQAGSATRCCKRGLAQENLGDIDVQSIAGAISTGTHGTGVRFGTLATQVAGLTLVTAAGEVLECSDERDPDIFKAAQVSLGALGVIAAVTLRVVPAKRLRFVSRRERCRHVLANLERYKRENSHFEFFWMPYTHWAQAKFLNETDDPAIGGNLCGSSTRSCWRTASTGRSRRRRASLRPPRATISKSPRWASPPSPRRTTATASSRRRAWCASRRWSITSRRSISRRSSPRFEAVMAREKFNVHFPIECRFVHGDDIWLSPAYGRESAYIAIHMYKGMPYESYFRAIEAIFQPYGGRPHWGKMHTLDAATLAARYPHWDDFRRVRAALDPNGVFLNDYLRRLFDADTPVAPAVGQQSGESSPTL